MNRYQENRELLGAFAGYPEEGSGFSVSGVVLVKNCKAVFPYGITARPVAGEEGVMLRMDGERCVWLGQIQDVSDLKEGEIRLRAKGGAEIKLCANGEILLNGLRITKDGVMERS